ncbi:hypothetical protein CR513_15232, partial [Mucuna pruriens]
MFDKGCSNTGSTMVIGKGFTKRSTFEGKSFTTSSREEYCMYCKRPGHSKDTCYKLYGKEKVLEQMSGNKGPTQMWDIQAFSKEEMDRLRVLLNSTSLLACILDSGETDHTTPFPSYFTSYLKVSKEQLITVANGDHVPIVGSGNVQLQSSLSLHNVLHVPKLANNLISIHRLIQDWNCLVTFFRSHCVIQELTIRRTIGVAKEQGGLYYLQDTKVGNNNKEDLPSSQRVTLETWTASQIWLYQKRLGHPPFGLIKTIFPHLFTKESFEFFKCDVCQFSKHYRATFSPSNSKSLEPFDLVHSNVWGPTSNYILGAKWFVSFIDDCTHVT